MMDHVRTKHRRAMALAAATGVIIIAATGAGCVATVPYEPRADVLEALAPFEAEDRLGQVIARAVEPRVVSAEVSETAYTVVWLETIHGPYGIPIGDHERVNQVHYANVARLELYENHYVYIYARDDRFLHKLLFASRADATTFIDLVWALRARRPSRAGG